MKCPRVCRELRWLARFGELGPSSQPHLDHLAGCAGCRDEVGFDRAMVQQLRSALALRVGGMTPSPDAWERILRRAQAPEPEAAGLWTRSTAMLGRLRTATAAAGTGLALVLALNMEVVPLALPSPSESVPATPAAISTSSASAPTFSDDQYRLAERPPLDPRPEADATVGTESIVPEPEGLVVQLDAPVTVPAVNVGPATPQTEAAPDVRVDGSLVTEIRVSFRNLLSPEPTSLGDSPAVVAEPIDVVPSVLEAGVPS